MAVFVLMSRFTESGMKQVRDDPAQLAYMRDTLERYEAKVLQDFHLFGEYDHCTIFEAPDNFKAYRASMEQELAVAAETEVLPAIDLPLFTRLLDQSTETTGPYAWQIGVPAQVARRVMRYYNFTRHVKAACKPLTITGQERLKGLKGPAIFVGNHSSHLDSLVLYQALPARYKRRAAFGGAADRWFIKGRNGFNKQGWWFSLSMNTYPITRGGGSKALDYSKWLLDKGWSLVIFPEGTRSTSRHLGKFRHGVSILALEKDVPVVPIYMHGLREIRPKGQKEIRPGPVTAEILNPIRFPPGTSVSEATRILFDVMNGAHERYSSGAMPAPEGIPSAREPVGLEAGGGSG